MKALLDIPIEINQTLNIIKAQYGFKNKVETISHIVNTYADDHLAKELRPTYVKKILAGEGKRAVRFKTTQELKSRYAKNL